MKAIVRQALQPFQLKRIKQLTLKHEREIRLDLCFLLTAQPLDTSDMDPELARYLNRHYWQQKSEEQQSQQPAGSSTVPSAPSANTDSRVSAGQVNEVSQCCVFMCFVPLFFVFFSHRG